MVAAEADAKKYNPFRNATVCRTLLRNLHIMQMQGTLRKGIETDKRSLRPL